MRAAWLLAALLAAQAAPAAAAAQQPAESHGGKVRQPSAQAAHVRESLQLAQLHAGDAVLWTWDAQGTPRPQRLPDDLRTPLGSLWKLFVHAYEADNAHADVPYRCGGQHRDEVYCCERGQSIGRDRALAKSCGLYFAPRRLGIDAAAWARYWRAQRAPAWLQDLAAMQPDTEVAVAELLEVLTRLPAQDGIRRVLLDVVLEARDPAVVAQLGSQWRVKTWSWHVGEDPDARIGGFAGWRADGTPVWAQGAGTSQQMLSTHAAALAALPPVSAPAPMPASADDCVDVRLFARYPIARIDAREGLLRGNYRVEFANGNAIEVHSGGEVMLDGERRLFARLSREEYVARVLDREAAAEPVHAARALAVAIRSYLQQNARRGGQCLAIDDSSATQRVAPRPASAAARAVAAFSADLVLTGAAVHYHRDRAAPDTLSWQHAVAQARSGSGWRDLLAATWPRATLARWDNPVHACRPLPAARDWLLARLAQWRPRLDREVGYTETRDFEVCVLAGGRPHVERAQRRLHVRALTSQQDRLDLVHEYLHLAFDAHPVGQDETYIEALARSLLLE